MNVNDKLTIEQRHLQALLGEINEKCSASKDCCEPIPNADTIHFEYLPKAAHDAPLFVEWETYRREVRGLLTTGNAGRHVLIKGDQIVGIWNSHDDAMKAGYERFLGEPFLVHQIQEHERVVRSVRFTRGNLIVMEMPKVIAGLEVLIGMDLLLDCKLLLDGPGRSFTLEF